MFNSEEKSMYQVKSTGRPPSAEMLAGFHRCWRCKELKEKERFYRDRTTADGYVHLCKSCNNVIIVSMRANTIKNNATIEELNAVASFYDKYEIL